MGTDADRTTQALDILETRVPQEARGMFYAPDGSLRREAAQLMSRILRSGLTAEEMAGKVYRMTTGLPLPEGLSGPGPGR